MSVPTCVCSVLISILEATKSLGFLVSLLASSGHTLPCFIELETVICQRASGRTLHYIMKKTNIPELFFSLLHAMSGVAATMLGP